MPSYEAEPAEDPTQNLDAFLHQEDVHLQRGPNSDLPKNENNQQNSSKVSCKFSSFFF